MIRQIAAVAVSLALSACGKPSSADYQAIHKDGLKKISYASDLDAQYQQVDHFITHFGFGKQPLIWNSEAFIHDRFTLTLQIPVTVDYTKKTVSIAGDPKFFLHATDGIDILPDGRATTRYDGDLQRHFGLTDWTKFKGAGFDLSALGIPAAEVRPEKHFDAYVASWRRDRVPIK